MTRNSRRFSFWKCSSRVVQFGRRSTVAGRRRRRSCREMTTTMTTRREENNEFVEGAASRFAHKSSFSSSQRQDAHFRYGYERRRRRRNAQLLIPLLRLDLGGVSIVDFGAGNETPCKSCKRGDNRPSERLWVVVFFLFCCCCNVKRFRD